MRVLHRNIFIYQGGLEFPEVCPGRYCGRQAQLNLTDEQVCYSECGVR